MAAIVADGGCRSLCLSSDHPLAAYYAQQDPSLDPYLALDDTAVWSAIEAATRGSNQLVSQLATRLRDRRRLKAIEMATEQPTPTDKLRREYIEANLSDEMGKTIFADRVPLTIYGGLKAGEARSHKRVRILRAGSNRAVDITSVSKVIAVLTEKQELLRYYFINDATCDRVSDIRGST